MAHKIVVTYWAKPIAIRSFDYVAYYDDDEPNDDGQMQYGYGHNEAEAVLDLITEHPRGGIECHEQGGVK